MNRRSNHISRVDRKVSKNPRPLINTIDGPSYVMVTKSCRRCKELQPINNFYFKSQRDSKKYDENDLRSRRNICITCWDELNK